MKLYGGGVILPGLVVFLILATLPLWFGAVAGAKTTFVSPPSRVSRAFAARFGVKPARSSARRASSESPPVLFMERPLERFPL